MAAGVDAARPGSTGGRIGARRCPGLLGGRWGPGHAVPADPDAGPEPVVQGGQGGQGAGRLGTGGRLPLPGLVLGRRRVDGARGRAHRLGGLPPRGVADAGGHHRTDDVAGHRGLPPRRHPHQAGPGGHGHLAGDPRAVPRPGRVRDGLAAAPVHEAPPGHHQVAAPPGARAPRARRSGRAPEDGVRLPHRQHAAGLAATLGRGAPRRGPPGAARACSIPHPSGRPGTSTSGASGTWPTSCGTCWPSRRGWTAGSPRSAGSAGRDPRRHRPIPTRAPGSAGGSAHSG